MRDRYGFWEFRDFGFYLISYCFNLGFSLSFNLVLNKIGFKNNKNIISLFGIENNIFLVVDNEFIKGK